MPFIFSSCATNYYYVNIDEDTPIYENTNGTESIIVIPKGYGAYISSSTKKYKKAKWKNYKGWVINPVYSYDQNSKNYTRYNSSASNNNSSSSYNSSTNKSTPGKTVHVKSYTRKDGTYVRAHTRSSPKRR